MIDSPSRPTPRGPTDDDRVRDSDRTPFDATPSDATPPSSPPTSSDRPAEPPRDSSSDVPIRERERRGDDLDLRDVV